jgi:hypothetical protein
MFNWYSEYLLVRARQREIVRAAESRQLLADGGDLRRSPRKQKRPRGESAISLRVLPSSTLRAE